MRLFISTMFLVVIAVSACVAYPVMPQADVDARRTVTAEALLVDPTAIVLATEEPVQQSCNIAGNISSSGEKIYHLPTGQYYSRVKIDLSLGEAWFCTEGEAAQQGFRRSSR